MDFCWPPETQIEIDRFERLGATLAETEPTAPGLDRQGWSACARAGLLGAFGPQADATSATVDLRGAVARFEALGRGGARRDLLFALGAHLFGCQIPLWLHGDARQQAKWLAPLASGEWVGALAVTEPQGGSSPAAIATRADWADGGLRLSGHKTLVTNAPLANLLLVIAATRPERGSFGWSALLVPADSPGIEIRPLHTLGLAGAPMGEIHFTGVRVGADQVLGEVDQGLRVFTSAMLWERIGIPAAFIGAAQRDLDAVVRYVNTRRMADQPLSTKQSIAHRLASARVRLERARLLILQAAWAVDSNGRSLQATVAMAKQDAAEAVVETALDLMRIGAGASWCGSLGAAEGLRDCLGLLSASGTAEVQLDIIAAAMGLKRR